MLLTEQEIKEAVGFTTDQMTAYRRIESAVLEKLKAQEPGITFDGMTALEFIGRELFEFQEATGCCTADEYLSHKHPLPPADVVRDAERLDWLMNSGRMVICDKEGCYTYTHTSGRYGPVAKTQREAIDAAMKETK